MATVVECQCLEQYEHSDNFDCGCQLCTEMFIYVKVSCVATKLTLMVVNKLKSQIYLQH